MPKADYDATTSAMSRIAVGVFLEQARPDVAADRVDTLVAGYLHHLEHRRAGLALVARPNIGPGGR